jgi:hypothetical protein
MPGATSVLDPPGFPGGGEGTALCKGVVVQKIVQKRGTGKGLALGWALRQEMCPLGEEGSSAPIGAASLRGGSKQGGGGGNSRMRAGSLQGFDLCSRTRDVVEGVFGMVNRAALDAPSVV